MTNNILIYTQPMCRYCDKAKDLLKNKGQNFQEIDITTSPELRQEMVAKANGRNTTPQIFINGQHVGGCDDLHDLENSKQLDKLLSIA
jgi:glutaredoxin 3